MNIIPQHLSFLTKSSLILYTSDNHPIEVWDLNVNEEDNLTDWAKHFRQSYCLDSEIDFLRDGTGLTRAEYLKQLVFPDETKAPGPSIRSGDFAELLIADYLQYLMNYWVPKGKFSEKESRNESAKGVDILGIKMVDPNNDSPNDELFTFEVKAQLTDTKYNKRLQTAIDDSSKDYYRQATTLNAIKRRLFRSQQQDKVLLVQRFQNPVDRVYKYVSGAAAVLSDKAYDGLEITKNTKIDGHQNASNLQLIIIRGSNLMKFVHALYTRAADEA